MSRVFSFIIYVFSYTTLTHAHASTVESRILSVSGMSVDLFGPNCGNAVLYALGLSGLRYSPPEELMIVLNSPLCREISAADKNTNTIVAFFDDSNPDSESLIHAALYMGNGRYFNKSDQLAMSEHEVTDDRGVRARQDSDSTVKYFRCAIELEIHPILEEMENLLSAKIYPRHDLDNGHPAVLRDNRGILEDREWTRLLRLVRKLRNTRTPFSATTSVRAKLLGLRGAMQYSSSNLCVKNKDKFKFALEIDRQLLEFCVAHKLECAKPAEPLDISNNECRQY